MPRKILMLLALVIIVGGLTYYFGFRHEEETTTAPGPLQVSAVSDSFSVSVQRALGEYYQLTEAFVQKDSGAVNLRAGSFAASMQAIAMQELKADSQLIALAAGIQQGIATEATAIVSNTDWTKKYRSLQTISDQFFDMLRTVQYKGGKVYQQHCPMAFDNTGANWLSQQPAIRNPYFGDDMLECGQNQDSVDFVQ